MIELIELRWELVSLFGSQLTTLERSGVTGQLLVVNDLGGGWRLLGFVAWRSARRLVGWKQEKGEGVVL